MAEQTHESPEPTQARPPINLSEEQAIEIVNLSNKALKSFKKLRDVFASAAHIRMVHEHVDPNRIRLRPLFALDDGNSVQPKEGSLPITTVEAIAAAVSRANEVFGNSEKAMRWLRTPIPSIGDTPMALLRTREGAARVEDALSAIELGVW
jgi:hypothetical protein